MGRRFKAWLDIMRLSNLPTVWANGLHGFAAGLFVYWLRTPANLRPNTLPVELTFHLNQAFMLMLSLSLIYIAGMIFNDVADVHEDRRDRPHRPIPRNDIDRRVAAIGAAIPAALGVAIITVYDEPAMDRLVALLVGCVACYDLVHNRRWTGLILLPVCRALAFLIGATAYAGLGTLDRYWWFYIGIPMLCLAVYTALITLIAWSEAKPGNAGRIKWVIGMIAAMPLVDAAFLFPIGQWQVALFCVGCAGLTLAGQRWIKGS